MWLNGEPYHPTSVNDARRHGIDTVYQDLALIDELSVWRNLFLHREIIHHHTPFLERRRMRREAREGLNQIGIDLPDVDAPVGRLSGGQRQAIAVARTVWNHSDVLLLNEPLAAMGAKEGGIILDLIARDKPTSETSVSELTNVVVERYRRARQTSAG